MARPFKKDFLTPLKRPSYEVLGESFRRGDAVELARRAGFSPDLLRRWTRAPEDRQDFEGNGRHNPLDTISIFAAYFREQDGNCDRGREIAGYVANLFDGYFVPVPPADLEPDATMLSVTSSILNEIANVLDALRGGFADRKFTVAEMARLEKECGEAQAALEAVKLFAHRNMGEEK